MSQQSSAASMTLDSWQQWEGRVVGGRYALLQYLAGSDHSAVYVTDFGGARAVAKLVAADAPDGAAQLSRWEAVCNLAHPNLLQVYDSGRWHADNEQDMFFAVMECADENLAEILSERALASAEARELLVPTLAALEYLHGRNLVHGGLKPSNVLAVGEQLKLAADGIRRSGTRLTSYEQEDWRAVPEVLTAAASSRNDIWALGLLVVESLTRKAKLDKSSDGALQVPEELSEPFRTIAHSCLQRDPAKRCSIADIRRMLERPPDALQPAAQVMPVRPECDQKSRLHEPETVTQPNVTAEKGTSAEAETAEGGKALNSQRNPQPQDFEPHETTFDSADSGSKQPFDVMTLPDEEEHAKPDKKRLVPFAIAILVALVALFALTRLVGRHSENERGNAQPAAPAVPLAAARVQQVSASVANPIVRPASGAVAQQVMPEVSRAAQNSIHGVVKVRVEANVDASGDVKQAHLKAHGPSRYFAEQALEATRQWKFVPPLINGAGVASRWTIEFDFKRSGVKAEPKMVSSSG